jgi:hypothetical protein
MCEGTQAPSGQVHIGRLLRGIEESELQAQAFGMDRLDAGLAPGAEEQLQT